MPQDETADFVIVGGTKGDTVPERQALPLSVMLGTTWVWQVGNALAVGSTSSWWNA